eukprot:5228214-Amphidinium_carterae.1
MTKKRMGEKATVPIYKTLACKGDRSPSVARSQGGADISDGPLLSNCCMLKTDLGYAVLTWNQPFQQSTSTFET